MRMASKSCTRRKGSKQAGSRSRKPVLTIADVLSNWEGMAASLIGIDWIVARWRASVTLVSRSVASPRRGGWVADSLCDVEVHQYQLAKYRDSSSPNASWPTASERWLVPGYGAE